MTTHKMKATYPIMTTHTMHYDRKNKSLPIISSSPLPLFKPGMVICNLEGFSFTFLINNTPHQSSHSFKRAHEAKARMRDLVQSYNKLYERFK